MLYLAGVHNKYCPYRDCLAIDTSGGRVSWYQLLAVPQNATAEELMHRFEQRRTIVVHNRTQTRNPVWDDILDELDRAYACLSHPVRKADYDDDLARRSRQTSLIRPCQLAAQEVAEFYADTRTVPGANAKTEGKKPALRDQFEPLRTIGCGRQGTKVFEAYEVTLGRTVAVKCLEKSARTPARCRSFIDEARFLASITHPHLVEIHSISEKNCFLVMELLSATVQEHFQTKKSGACSPGNVADFLRQALAVIECIHERGVIHGGISLSSFLVAESGGVKLVDTPGCTAAGIFRAPSPDQICIAPETLSPDTFGEAKAGVDLYMLGFVAVQLLAGDQLLKWFPKVSAHRNADPKLWHRWHSSPLERLPSLEELVPGIPEQLVTVIEKLCEKQVADRYHSAAEAQADLAPVPAMQASGETADRSGRAGRRADAMPAVEHKGGGAPVIVDARPNAKEPTDWFTILQDPELLWATIRQHGRLQILCGASTAAILVILFWPQRPLHLMADSGSSVPMPLPDPSMDLLLNAVPDPSTELLRIAVPDPTQDLLPDVPMRRPAFVDLEQTSPVSFRKAEVRSSLSTSVKETPLQQPVARTFGVVGVTDPAQVEQLRKLLAKIRDARRGDDRRTLLDKAAMLAPNDPRPAFVYAAVNGFGPGTKEELLQAVRLSTPDFTQPFRMKLEMILRGPDRPEVVADYVLAELIHFRDQLDPMHFSSDDTYDWEWIGRVAGYLELTPAGVDSVRTILVRNLPRICDDNHPNVSACIERGRLWVKQHDRSDVSAGILFPPLPMLEIDLCLRTLESANAESIQRRSATPATTVAENRFSVEKPDSPPGNSN